MSRAGYAASGNKAKAVVADKTNPADLVGSDVCATCHADVAKKFSSNPHSKLALLHGQVDAAIVDLGLPDATGDSLIKELRLLYPALPIVISSGYDEATLRDRFPNERSVALLSKPFTAEQLEAAISDLGIKP